MALLMHGCLLGLCTIDNQIMLLTRCPDTVGFRSQHCGQAVSLLWV